MTKRWTALVALIVASCNALPDVDQRIDLATTKAAEQGFASERIAANPFTLQAFHRGLDSGAAEWRVYFEGDGQAFLTRTKLSPDPTPTNPVGLDLALADPAPAVLYLGRPCQFRPADDVSPCPSRYWSSHRFADEVVRATLRAIDTLLAEHGDGSTGITAC